VAPRDALVADVDASNRGAAYGLMQFLDMIGALLGPLLAIVVLDPISPKLSAGVLAGSHSRGCRCNIFDLRRNRSN